MKRHLVWITLFAALLLPMTAVFLSAAKEQCPEGQEVRDLLTDAHILNLLNGLYLSKEQMQGLLALAREAERDRNQVESQINASSQERIRALSDLRVALLANQGVPDDVAKRVIATKDTAREALEQLRKRQTARAEKATEFLTENQLTLVAEFKPCLLPPKDQRNPARIGQASSSSRFAKLLVNARKIPEDRYQQAKPRILARLEEGFKKHHLYPEDQIPQKVQEVGRMMDQARAMSDLDFEARKVQLAEQISPPEPAPLKGKRLQGRVSHLLINSRIIPILEQRIAAG